MPAHSLFDLSADLLFSWIGVAAIFAFAGFVKGLIGLGLPTVAMGLLGSFMPAAQAAALLIVPSLVTNLWQMLTGGTLAPLVRRLWTLQAGIVAGTLASPYGVSMLDERVGSAALGLCLMVYALAGLASVRLQVPAGREAWLSPCVGLVTGVVTAATGVFVFPAVPYLQSLRLRRDELVQGLGLSFTVATAALGVRLWWDGALFGGDAASPGAWALPLLVALAGMSVGRSLRAFASERNFERLFFGGLAVVGAHVTAKSLLG